MREELFKQSIINIINQNEQQLSSGCIYYILKDVLNQVEKEYKIIAEKEFQEYQKQQQDQNEVKEEEV
jgi:hypothetical protein